MKKFISVSYIEPSKSKADIGKDKEITFEGLLEDVKKNKELEKLREVNTKKRIEKAYESYEDALKRHENDEEVTIQERITIRRVKRAIAKGLSAHSEITRNIN